MNNSKMTDTVSVRKIEISRLYPGCPPEHYREYVTTVSYADDLNLVLSHIEATKNQKLKESEEFMDGGCVTEYKIFMQNGEVETVILSGAEMPRGII